MGQTVKVTVHSIGSLGAPASRVRLLDKGGKEIASAAVPAMKGPVDLVPVHAEVTLTLPAGSSLNGDRVVIDSGVEEITLRNNSVGL